LAHCLLRLSQSGTGKLDQAALTAIKESLKEGAAESAVLMDAAGVAHGGPLEKQEREALQRLRKETVQNPSGSGGGGRKSIFDPFSRNDRASVFGGSLKDSVGLHSLEIPAPLEDLALLAHSGFSITIPFNAEGLGVPDAQLQALLSVAVTRLHCTALRPTDRLRHSSPSQHHVSAVIDSIRFDRHVCARRHELALWSV
jgi:hypothetical protein